MDHTPNRPANARYNYTGGLRKLLLPEDKGLHRDDFILSVLARYQKHNLRRLLELVGPDIFLELVESHAGMYIRFPTPESIETISRELKLLRLYQRMEGAKRKTAVELSQAAKDFMAWAARMDIANQKAVQMNTAYPRAVRVARETMKGLQAAKKYQEALEKYEKTGTSSKDP